MARCTNSGMDSFIKDIDALRDGAEELSDKLIKAGSEEYAKARRKAAQDYDFFDSGDMQNAIKATNPKSQGGVRFSDIYSQGKDRRGIRNAEKEFILHYGTSRDSKHRIQRKKKKLPGPGIPPTHWVDKAEEKAAEPAQAAMEQVFNNELEQKGMI